MKPLLTADDLVVRYGAVEVLKGISLEVYPGEIVALIGANGAGKTTTLMALCGLSPVIQGRLRFLGFDLGTLSPEQIVAEGITQVPEGRRIFPRLTVMENLLIGAGLRKDRAQVKKDLEGMLSSFPVLRERPHQLAGTLSGGEQQITALARGLMARPKLLLLDEPSLGLAPKLVAHVFEIIRTIQLQGYSILLVEQNAYQALQVAGRGYVLETGRILLAGSAEALRKNPAVKQAYLGG